MAFKLALNRDSVDVLRYLADKLPNVFDNVENDTQKLLSVYNSLAEDLGIHKNDFEKMILHVKKSQIISADAVLAMTPLLKIVADRIENYINGGNGDEGDPQKVKKMRL